MTKQEIFNYFYTNSANLSGFNILIIMLAGVGIATIIYLTYYFCYRGVAYNRKFNISLGIILLISVVIMMMISSNIVISLGMVGALSIVRFRTAIKDSRDTVFIFWAIAEGLCVGSSNFKLSLITTLIIAIVLCATSYIPNLITKYLVIIRGEKKDIDLYKVLEELNNYSNKCEVKNINKDSLNQEIILEVLLKDKFKFEIVDKLPSVSGVESVNIISETTDYIG